MSKGYLLCNATLNPFIINEYRNCYILIFFVKNGYFWDFLSIKPLIYRQNFKYVYTINKIELLQFCYIFIYFFKNHFFIFSFFVSCYIIVLILIFLYLKGFTIFRINFIFFFFFIFLHFFKNRFSRFKIFLFF